MDKIFKNLAVKIQSHHYTVLGYMGRIATLGLIFLYSITSCTKVDTTFYNKVLNNFDSTSYFVALNVKSTSYKGRVIIENNNLYKFLHLEKGFSVKKYQSYMIRIMAHNRYLRIDDKDIEKWNFIKVPEIENVILIANRGRDKFVEYYFNGFMLNYGIPDEERNAVINQLFYWAIPARIDKITGVLMIG
jgi:hypothetical protein